MTTTDTSRPRRQRRKPLSPDEALIALFIGAMNANDLVSREELARAQHLIGYTKRFRRKSGETLGRLIARMKARLDEEEPAVVMTAAAKAIPAAQRRSAFAVVTDLVLADGKIDARERKFLRRLAVDLGLQPAVADRVVDVMLVKNRL